MELNYIIIKFSSELNYIEYKYNFFAKLEYIFCLKNFVSSINFLHEHNLSLKNSLEIQNVKVCYFYLIELNSFFPIIVKF